MKRMSFLSHSEGDRFDKLNSDDGNTECLNYYRAGFLEALFGLVATEKISLEDVVEYAGISWEDAEELLQGWKETRDPERMHEIKGGDLC